MTRSMALVLAGACVSLVYFLGSGLRTGPAPSTLLRMQVVAAEQISTALVLRKMLIRSFRFHLPALIHTNTEFGWSKSAA